MQENGATIRDSDALEVNVASCRESRQRSERPPRERRSKYRTRALVAFNYMHSNEEVKMNDSTSYDVHRLFMLGCLPEPTQDVSRSNQKPMPKTSWLSCVILVLTVKKRKGLPGSAVQKYAVK